jgi:hypothetical protein
MVSLMSSTLGMHGHASEAESHGACGDARALPHWETGLEPQDTWPHWIPSLLGGGPRGMGYMVMPEPSRTERWVWSRGTCGDTGALPCRVAGSVARGDTRALPHRETGLVHGTRGNTRSLPCRVVCQVPQGT